MRAEFIIAAVAAMALATGCAVEPQIAALPPAAHVAPVAAPISRQPVPPQPATRAAPQPQCPDIPPEVRAAASRMPAGGDPASLAGNTATTDAARQSALISAIVLYDQCRARHK